MTPIFDNYIDRKLAWHGSDFKSKDDVAFDLTSRQVAALESILLRVRPIPRDEIRIEHCTHPALDNALAAVLDEVQNRRGMVIIRGMPVSTEKYTVDEIERMCWIVCQHLGTVLSGSSLGAKMVPIQSEVLADGSQPARGTKSSQELAMHTDISEVFALLCVRQAREGGETQFASALAVHNAILAARPDVLPILYRGFPHHRRGEQPDHKAPVTPYDMPVFANVNGYVGVGQFSLGGIYAGLHALGRKITAAEQEALDVLQQTAVRLQFELRFEPGDMSVVNNYTVFHSRSEYVDGDEPQRRRLIYRVWLEAARDRRPIIPEMLLHENEGGRSGVDEVPGRSKVIRQNEYLGVPDELTRVIKEGQKKKVMHPDTPTKQGA